MSLLKKYRRQMTFSILATTILYMAPDYFTTDVQALPSTETIQTYLDGPGDDSHLGYLHALPSTIASDEDNLALIDSTSYTNTTSIIEQAIKFTELKTSTIEGLDLLATAKFVIDEEKVIQSISDILLKPASPALGFMAQFKEMENKLGDPVAAVKALNVYTGQGPDYVTDIGELKALVHYVDAHLDYSAALPEIKFDDIMYGEGTGHPIYGPGVTVVKINASTNKPQSFPIPDIQWPDTGKPDYIDVKLSDTDGTDLGYNPKRMPTVNLTTSPDSNGPEAVVIYTLTDTSTGKQNKLALEIDYTSTKASMLSMAKAAPTPPQAFNDPDATEITPVAINVSEDGGEILESAYWVTPTIYDALTNALNDAVDALNNVYRKAAIELGGDGLTMTTISSESTVDSTKKKFDDPITLNANFIDMATDHADDFPNEFNVAGSTQYGYARLPNETDYLLANMPATNGTDANHTSMTELTEITTALTDAYTNYITTARVGTGILINESLEGKVESQIAKAFLGLNPSKVLPDIPDGLVDITSNNKDSDGTFVFNQYANTNANANPGSFSETEDTIVGSIYLYTRKATPADVANSEVAAVPNLNLDGSTPLAKVGDPIATTKAEADGVTYYIRSTAAGYENLPELDTIEEGFTDTAQYFIVPAITDDPYKVGNWTPGGTDSALTETVGKYLNAQQVTDNLRILEGLLAEYDLYDGYSPEGTKLAGSQYIDELKAGAETITPEGNYTATTKIGLATEKLVEFYTKVQGEVQEGEAAKKAEALDTLKKYLIYVDYATYDDTAPAAPIFAVVDQTTLDTHALNSKTPVSASNSSVATTKIESADAFNPAVAFDAITSRADYHNISDYYGVDISDSGHHWVTQKSHNDLVAALKRAHNLVESGFISQTAAAVDPSNTYITDHANTVLESTDNKFYTLADVEAEILKVKTAIDAYDSSAQDSTQGDFQTSFIGGTLTAAMTNIKTTFTLPTTLTTPATDLTTYKVLYQTVLNSADTVISDDGVFAITRDITGTPTTGYTFSPADVSLIQNKALIDDGTITNYLLSEDVKTAYTSIQPILDINAISGQFTDIHGATIMESDGTTPDPIKTAALKEFMQKIIFDHYDYTPGTSEPESTPEVEETVFEIAEQALIDLAAKKSPVIPYKTPREELITTLGTIQEAPTKQADGTDVTTPAEPSAIRALIKVEGDVVYINDSVTNKLVISEDEGYTYITYTPSADGGVTPGSWSEPALMEDSTFKWTTKADLEAYNTVLEAAEKALLDSRAEASLIDPGANADPDKTDDAEGAKMDPPDLTLTFAKATLKPEILEKIKEMVVDESEPTPPAGEEGDGEAVAKLDYFDTQKDAVEKAKAAFEATHKAPQDISVSKIAYDNFMGAIGKPSFVDRKTNSTFVEPNTNTTLGYISSDYREDTTSTVVSAGSGLLEDVFAFTNTDGEEQSYFPMNVYVVNDKGGIKNPITKHAYGYLVDGTSDGNAPDNFVHEDAAEKFITAVKLLKGFAGKKISDHLTAFDADPEYFNKELATFQAAVDEFTAAIKPTTSGDYVDAYEAIFGKIVNDITTPTGPLPAVATLNDDKGAPVTGVITFQDDFDDDKKVTEVKLADTSSPVVKESEDGINDPEGDALDPDTTTHWITPSNFYKLKSAILKVQDIVTEAEEFSTASMNGFAANPDYFQNKYELIGLEELLADIFITNYEKATSADAADWVTKAEILLYGDADPANQGTVADTPGGDVEDMNISSLTDGFDVLTLSKMTSFDPDGNGLDDAELDAMHEIEYISKDLADKLRDALSVVKADVTNAEADDVETLAKLVNEGNNNKKVVTVVNNPKIDLYNTYVKAVAALTDEEGYAIVASDNKGANVSRDRFWVTTPVLTGLNTAISNTERLLNTVETAKTAETAFKNQLVNQKNVNDRTVTAFKPLPGTASDAAMDELLEAKEELLATINKAAALVGVQEYLPDGTQNSNAVVLEEGQIVISTLFGIDVSGEDRDGNLVPDSGDRWTTLASHTALTRAITAGVNSYKAGGATTATIVKANDVLTLAITNLEKTSFYGAKETYSRVTALMQQYIDAVTNGLSVNDIYIPANDEVKESAMSGADVAITALWTTKLEKDKLNNAVKAAQATLDKYANVDTPTVKLDLPKFVLELNKIELAFENFYGRTIEGEEIEGIVSKTQYGTDGLESLEIRTAIENAVASMNNLSYLSGATRPAVTYTLADGTPNNSFGYDRYILELGTWTAKDDGKNGNGFTSDDVLVSSKTRGMDVPVGFSWIANVAVNQYATAISAAQRTLDTFEATPVERQNQLTLDNAVLALERATIAFNNAVQGATSDLVGEKLTYERNYKKLDAAIAEAYQSIGYSYDGKETEDVLPTLEDTPLNIGKTIEQSFSGDGQDVSSSIFYLPVSQFTAYKNAIINAAKSRDMANATDKSLEMAYTNLQKAIDPILSRFVKPGQSATRDTKVGTLDELISKAESYIKGDPAASDIPAKFPITASVNGSDVADNRYWTTTANLNNMIAQVNVAKTTILNLDTDADPVTGVKGTGKSTLALLDRSITNLGNVLKLVESNGGKPQLGKLQANVDSGLAAIAKGELKVLIDLATTYSKYKVSSFEGTDVPDGVQWITGLAIDEFSYEVDGNGQSLKPTAFILQAYKNANLVYIKSPLTTPAAQYEAAAITLQHCIDQFELVLNGTSIDPDTNEPTSTMPDETEETGVAYSGKGTLNSINTAKANITATVAQYNTIVKSTRKASSDTEIALVPDGQYYADSGAITDMTNAINQANTDLRSVQRTAGALKFFQDSLATLKAEYEAFTGISDGDDSTAAPNDIPRKLKGKLAVSDAASLAAQALTDIFEDAKNVIVPIANDGTAATNGTATAYLESFIRKVINDDSVDFSFSTGPDVEGTKSAVAGTAEKPEGELGEGTFTLDITLKDGTIESINGKFGVAAVPYKWNAITKADVLASAALINSVDEFIIDGALLNVKDDTTNGIVAKNENGLLAAKEIKDQIEKLIANDSITVTIVASNDDANTDINIMKDLTLDANKTEAGSAYDVQTNDTAKEEGEDGAFEFKVVLSIPYSVASSVMAMSNIEDEVEEVLSDLIAGASGSADDYYTVILKSELVAKVTPAAYKESSISDATAVTAAVKAFETNRGTTPLTVVNTLDDPAHTDELIKAQLIKQIRAFLVKPTMEAPNSNDPTIDYKAFQGVTFEIEKIADSTLPTDTTPGSYKFNIKFIKGNETSSVETFANSALSIPANPPNPLKGLKDELENFPTYVATDKNVTANGGTIFNLTTDNAASKGAADASMLAYLEATTAAVPGLEISIESEYKAPILSTSTKFGTNGFYKFVATLKQDGRELKTFSIYVPIIALPYKESQEGFALNQMLLSLGVDVNDLADFEEVPVYDNVEYDNYDDMEYFELNDEFEEEFLYDDEQYDYNYDNIDYYDNYDNDDMYFNNDDMYFNNDDFDFDDSFENNFPDDEQFFDEEQYYEDQQNYEEEFLNEFVKKNSKSYGLISSIINFFKRS